MPKPIDKIEFWKERIETAVKPHYSVYVIHEVGWKQIFNAHKTIISQLIKPTDTVLDAGCGYGRMSVLFDNYTGVDFSPDFIELATKQFPNKNFIQADLKKLPFHEEQFDWAICVSIKKMVEDNLGIETWESMAKELKRVAKKVLILEYEDPNPYEIL